MFYMQYKGRGKAAKVVNFVTKWLNLCLSTVPGRDFQMLKVLAILIVTVESITVVLMVQDWLEPITVVLRVGHWRRHSPMVVTAATTVSVVAT